MIKNRTDKRNELIMSILILFIFSISIFSLVDADIQNNNINDNTMSENHNLPITPSIETKTHQIALYNRQRSIETVGHAGIIRSL